MTSKLLHEKQNFNTAPPVDVKCGIVSNKIKYANQIFVKRERGIGNEYIIWPVILLNKIIN